MEPHRNPTTCESSPILDSGEMVFRVRRGDGCQTDHHIDLLALKLTCEECEQAHGLKVVDGGYQPTAAFLVDLAGRIELMGVERCTPTIAWQMWVQSANEMESLKNALSETPN